MFEINVTHHWCKHHLVVRLKLVLAGVLARRSEMELVQLHADMSIFQRAEFLLQLFGKQVVVASHQVDVRIVDVIIKHHLDERFRHIFATVLEIDSRVLNAHAFVDAANGSLLSANIDNAGNGISCSECCRQTFLDETDTLEAEIDKQLAEDGGYEYLLVHVGYYEYTGILRPVLLAWNVELVLDCILDDEEEVAIEEILTLVLVLVQPAIFQWP